jgi:hypothetical protein
MSTESHILLSNVIAETTGYSEKQKGSGYNRRGDGVHTVVYQVDSFNGTITIQGTLALHPGNNDWVDLASVDYTSDSTVAGITTSASDNFTGNFVWIRAAYDITDGTIVSVRYNY